jgi:hypothetical protein
VIFLPFGYHDTEYHLGFCGAGHKAQQAKKNGAIGIVFVNPVLFTIESGSKPDTTAGLHDFPMIDLVPKKKYSAIVDAIKKGEVINVTITPGLKEIVLEIVMDVTRDCVGDSLVSL